ncbi:MAG: hypothetical protein H0W50_00155 [Parachlamydiaceae bacterium]|nr:hypothetical protein [Parachlamydiaceae bacterium]
MCATAEFIQNFGIRDEGTLIEIARLFTQQSGGRTALFIQKFSIKNEGVLIEFAKLSAQQNGWFTAQYIQNFGIKDEAAIIDIAKLCAQQNGTGTALHIKNLGIKDEGTLIEIAKLCAQQSGAGTAENIQNFGIKDEGALFELFLVSLKYDKSVYMQMKNFKPLPGIVNKLADLVEVLKSSDEEEARRIMLYETLSEMVENFSCSDEIKNAINDLTSEIAKYSPHVQREAAIWLVHSLLLMERSESQTIDWIISSGLLRELGNLRHPNLSHLFTTGLFELGASKNKHEWEDFINRTNGLNGLSLLAIPLFEMQEQGVNKQLIFKFINYLSSLDISGHAPLKSVFAVRNLLEAVQLLSSTDILTPEKKSSGFAKFFPKPKKMIKHKLKKMPLQQKGYSN